MQGCEMENRFSGSPAQRSEVVGRGLHGARRAAVRAGGLFGAAVLFTMISMVLSAPAPVETGGALVSSAHAADKDRGDSGRGDGGRGGDNGGDNDSRGDDNGRGNEKDRGDSDRNDEDDEDNDRDDGDGQNDPTWQGDDGQGHSERDDDDNDQDDGDRRDDPTRRGDDSRDDNDHGDDGGQGDDEDEGGDGAGGAGVTTENAGRGGGARANGHSDDDGDDDDVRDWAGGTPGGHAAHGDGVAAAEVPGGAGAPGGITDDEFEDRVAAGGAAPVRDAMRATALSADEETAAIAAGWAPTE